MAYFVIFVLSMIAIFTATVVPDGQSVAVMRAGKFYTIWDSGVHFKMPLVDKLQRVPSADSYNIIETEFTTQDGVKISLSICVRFIVIDAFKYYKNASGKAACAAGPVIAALDSVIGDTDYGDFMQSVADMGKAYAVMDASAKVHDFGLEIEEVLISDVRVVKDGRA